jgi:hypothetical protein
MSPYETIQIHEKFSRVYITYGMTIITCNLTVMLVQQIRSIVGGLIYQISEAPLQRNGFIYHKVKLNETCRNC